MNLWDLKVNETASIDAVPTNKDSKFSMILAQLGLKKDSLIKCLHKTIFSGPRVYEINGVVCTLCKNGAKQVVIHQ